MGGFDPHYLPAYCEDADLAFRVRAAGLRCVYQPASEVVHHEGRSHGRDTGTGIKAYQLANQAKLAKRWQAELAADHYPNAVNVWRARDRSGARRHVLVVDHYVPQWDRDAGSRSTFETLRSLVAMGVAVTFWPDNLHCAPGYTAELQQMGVEVIYGPQWAGRFGAFLAEREGLYEAAILNRPHIAGPYIAALRQHSSARLLYYGHDLHWLRMQRHFDTTGEGSAEAIARMRRVERDVCLRADCVLFPDPVEVAQVQAELGEGRDYVALPVVCYDEADLAKAHTRAPAQRREALFVGGFGHPPNRDGLLWFVREVMPLLPDLRLTVAGSIPPADVLALHGGRICVRGYVSDEELEQLYARADVAVAPLRFGAGVKGKVVEAMARGVPLVTTPVGAQGIAQAGEVMALADTADAFAEAVAATLDDAAAAQARVRRGLDVVARDFSREAMQRVLRAALGF